MLNFHLDLQSPLFMNLQTFFDTIKDCYQRRVPFAQAMREVREQFPNLTEDQYFELRYEWQEFLAVKHQRPRHSFWDLNESGSNKVRDMLIARSESDFVKNPYFIQFMGRGMRKGKE